MSGSNSTALLCRASDQPCGLSLSARETPTTGIKKKLPQLVWGISLFYLRRVSGSNSTALLCRASDQPCGLSLSARETPTTGIKKKLPQLVWGSFAFLSAACEHDLVVCIGRDRHTGLHHFQPVHEKIVEKYGMMTLPIS